MMPETKAISSVMAIFFFMRMKFGLQNNGIFAELLPSLQNFLLVGDIKGTLEPEFFWITSQRTNGRTTDYTDETDFD